MSASNRLWDFVAPDLLGDFSSDNLTLVHAFPGLIDAGQVCQSVTSYLTDAMQLEEVIRFDMDELLDYRSTRMTTSFKNGVFGDIKLPQISLAAGYDEMGKAFLFLHGPEPDLRWNALAAAIVEIADIFNVSRVVGIHGVPTNTPHTRPLSLIEYGLQRENLHALPDVASPNWVADAEGLLEATKGDDQEVIIPVTFHVFLHNFLEKHGYETFGYAAHIPHYLARTEFPAGALALLRRVSDAADLDIPLMDLGDMADSVTAEIDQQIRESEEARVMVKQLEEAYDRAEQTGNAFSLSTTPDMPTADEIGERFERFLADQSQTDATEASETSREDAEVQDLLQDFQGLDESPDWPDSASTTDSNREGTQEEPGTGEQSDPPDRGENT